MLDVSINEQLSHIGQFAYSENSNFVFDKFSSMFIFTTENIKGYVNNIDVNGKTVLAPCASGDHAFESILKGATRVDMFDINIFAYQMVMLKAAAIKTLEREEFIDFFLKNKKKKSAFNRSVYTNKIREALNDDSKLFWDHIYSYFKDTNKLRESALFLYDQYEHNSLTKINDYVKEEYYDLLKSKIGILDKSEFFRSNVIDLPNNLNEKYDIIMLSNIQDYMSNTYNCSYLEALKKYRQFLKHDLMNHVNEDGIIVGEYYYHNSAVPSISPAQDADTIKFDAIYPELQMAFPGGPDQVKVYKKNQ